ncbi:MAG: site-2 protease family protein [Candidatus Marinimicrobia bacterium]|nr:site-2 protease family protein [Candidatus Neomarinimicrobiota bacterium]
MLLTIITALIVLSILILVHELGHFLAAKKAGIGVEEFGLGYPPRIIGKKIGQTVYSLNAIPFGGFVRLSGEEIEEAEKLKDKKKSFWAKSKKARTTVIVAGVLANFLLAIVCFSVVYSLSGIPTKTDQVKVVGVSEDSPAAQAGFLVEDLILAVNEKVVTSMATFVELVEENKGQEIRVKVAREENNPCQEKVLGGMGFSCEGGNLILFVVPREEPPEGEGALGVVISEMEMKKYSFWQMPFYGTREGLKEAFSWTRLVVEGLGSMVGNLVTKGRVPKEIAGPVGILQITSTVARSGVLTILQFIGVLSINLAVLNILPFPALDGGRLLFIGYEVVTGKKPKPKIEHWVNLIGIVILMFLLVLVTINDLHRIIETTSLGAKLRSIVSF